MAIAQICTFVVNDLLMAVEVKHVQEVLQQQTVTPVPLAPKAVRGLINLRGQIVTAIALKELLDLEAETSANVSVVLRSAGSLISLLVDDIGDVIEVDEDRLETPPKTLEPALRKVVEGVCKLGDGLLLLLDADALLGQSS